jgi:chromosome partitioning protein
MRKSEIPKTLLLPAWAFSVRFPAILIFAFTEIRKFAYPNMLITIASFKGGVGKTTTAIHLAAYFQSLGKTVLIDGDPNRSATAWTGRGKFGFDVVDEFQMAKVARGGYEHIILDTAARPNQETIKSLAEGCDMLILPSTPDLLALDALRLTIQALQEHDARQFKILLTMVRPKPARDGEIALGMLKEAGLPVFDGMIRRYQSFVTAASLGLLVSGVNDPRAHLGAEDYQAVGEELAA